MIFLVPFLVLMLVSRLLCVFLAIYLHICASIDEDNNEILKNRTISCIQLILVPFYLEAYIVYIIYSTIHRKIVAIFTKDSWIVKNGINIANILPTALLDDPTYY